MQLKDNGRSGTLKHRLVSYVMNYDKQYFCKYTELVINEMKKRNIKYQNKFYDEIFIFCNGNITAYNYYTEHNERYLKQCFYNLQEKADRGIISEKEFKKVIEVYEKEINEYEKII